MKKKDGLKQWYSRDFWNDVACVGGGLAIAAILIATDSMGLPVKSWLLAQGFFVIIGVILAACVPLAVLSVVMPRILTRRRLAALRRRLARLEKRIRGRHGSSPGQRDPLGLPSPRNHTSPETIPVPLVELLRNHENTKAEIAALETLMRYPNGSKPSDPA